MNTKNTKDAKDKTGRDDFESIPKGFHEFFQGMRKCCMGQGGNFDCSAMMDKMMKNMTEMYRGPKTDSDKQDPEE